MARKINFDEPAPESAGAPESPGRPLLGLARTIRPTGALGAISHSLGDISEKVRRADEIEQKLLRGQAIVELDPELIDGSFVSDRMEATEEQNAAFRELIRRHGQNVPILVRPKAGRPDRFEVAFGHRRLRAARELGIKVKAVVRSLTDEELVVAQGQENSGRADLTFIERARFAARLEERKFPREIIMAALNVDKAALSHLISIANRVPAAVIEAVGPAPAHGRRRWLELAELMQTSALRDEALTFVKGTQWSVQDSDARFDSLVAALREPRRLPPDNWYSSDGVVAAKISRAGKRLSLTFDDRVTPQFGEFVRKKLAELYQQYKQGEPPR